MSNDIKLEYIDIRHCGAITPNSPVLLDLSGSGNIVLVEGEQQTGKTTTLAAIRKLLGGGTEFREDNLINKDSGKIEAEMSFERDGVAYTVRWTKSQFKLTKEGEDQLSPVETLRKLIGPLGLNPMPLKTKDGATQIRELRKVLNVPPEIEEQEERIKAALREADAARTMANREYTRLEKKVDYGEISVVWESNEIKYQQERDQASAFQKVVAAEKEYSELERGKNRLNEINSQIDELLRRQKEAFTYINARSEAPEKLRIAREEHGALAQYERERAQWLLIKGDVSEMQEYESAVISLDAQRDELRADLLELAEQGLPDIEGLRIVPIDALDGMEAGVYYHDKRLEMLSESEIWGLALRIWGSQSIRFAIVENISSLGTDAIQILNGLAAQGVRVFASQMRRKEPLTISITDKLD